MALETPASDWIDFGNLAIGIGTFLLAITLGIVTWVRANRDRRFHVADKRQDWINDLRDTISEYLAICSVVVDMKEDDDIHQKVERYTFLIRKISLMLNPDEDKSKKLLSKIEEMKEFLMIKGEQWEFEDLSDNITHVTQKILKEEWERVKSLDRKKNWR